jgi:hypothetical protein
MQQQSCSRGLIRCVLGGVVAIVLLRLAVFQLLSPERLSTARSAVSNQLETLQLSFAAPPQLASSAELASLLRASRDATPSLPFDAHADWIERKPLCSWRPGHCNVYREDVALVRDWRARIAKQRSQFGKARPHPLCPRASNASRGVSVYLYGSFPWGNSPRALQGLDKCPVRCHGEQGFSSSGGFDSTIVVGARHAPGDNKLFAHLALEHNFERMTARGLREVDVLASWQRVSDVYVNYFYAWVSVCGDPRASPEPFKCLRPAPTMEQLAADRRKFAVAFISNCGSWAWWVLRGIHAHVRAC